MFLPHVQYSIVLGDDMYLTSKHKWVPVALPRLVNGHYSLWLRHS